MHCLEKLHPDRCPREIAALSDLLLGEALWGVSVCFVVVAAAVWSPVKGSASERVSKLK